MTRGASLRQPLDSRVHKALGLHHARGELQGGAAASGAAALAAGAVQQAGHAAAAAAELKRRGVQQALVRLRQKDKGQGESIRRVSAWARHGATKRH